MSGTCIVIDCGSAVRGSGLCKYHLDQRWRQERTRQRREQHARRTEGQGFELIESCAGDPPHWACPDCGTPCYCIDPIVRALPHRPCSVPEVIAA